MLIVRTVHSPFGQVLKAIRENEPRAISLGYDVDGFKLLAFVLSAALAGLAGATKALVLGFATLDRCPLDHVWAGDPDGADRWDGNHARADPGRVHRRRARKQSRRHRRIPGPYTGIEWFNGLGEAVTIVTGLIFVICVMAFRRGLVGEFQAWWSRRRAPLAVAT